MKLCRNVVRCLVCLFASWSCIASGAENVEITPLGSHDGEFCRFDRALIFEASSAPVHVPLSGKTMAFDEDGGCVSGC